jgi:hypothetical protein
LAQAPARTPLSIGGRRAADPIHCAAALKVRPLSSGHLDTGTTFLGKLHTVVGRSHQVSVLQARGKRTPAEIPCFAPRIPARLTRIPWSRICTLPGIDVERFAQDRPAATTSGSFPSCDLAFLTPSNLEEPANAQAPACPARSHMVRFEHVALPLQCNSESTAPLYGGVS